MQGCKQIIAALAVLIFVALTAAGCGSNNVAEQVEEPKTAVELSAVSVADIVQKARVTGMVKSGTTAPVMAAVPAKLEAVLVDVGDTVTEGQVVARLESSQQEAALLQAQAGVEQAKVQAELDGENLKRTQVLFEEGAASQQALEMAEAAVAASQARLVTAEAALQQAQIALDNCYIKAPISGKVAARLLEPGTIAQGAILTLVSGGDLQVEIGVTEQDINYLQPGKEVTVEIPAASLSQPLMGRVSSVSPAADERTRLFNVNIKLDSPPKEVRPGMTAAVTYSTRRAAQVIAVPKNAVLNRGGQNLVFTVVDGRVEARVVSTGIDDGEKIEISSGLTAEDKIITKGQEFVSEGQQVEVVSGGPQS